MARIKRKLIRIKRLQSLVDFLLKEDYNTKAINNQQVNYMKQQLMLIGW